MLVLHQIYTLLVAIHIFAAIVGVGPAFAFNRILNKAKNMKELKHAHKIVDDLQVFAGPGFTLALITGLLMGLINLSLFQTLWYNLSIALLLAAMLYKSFVAEPKMKPMLEIVKTYKGEEIPQDYKILNKKMAPYDYFGKVILIVIIILMIFKP